MFAATSIEDQLALARGDRLRVLVVGAGVAGLSLAQALRAGGLHPVLLERADDHADAGYMLALMPLVDPLIRRLGLREAYWRRSERFQRYRLHGRHGQRLREYAIGGLLERYGDYRGIARGELMQVLAEPGAPVSYGATLRALEQTPRAARATLCQGDAVLRAEFDVVVLADGLHSASRALLLPAGQVATYDTHWGGWVAWADVEPGQAERGDECWAARGFVGAYPVKGRVGVFVGGHRDDTGRGVAAFAQRLRADLPRREAWLDNALDAVLREGDATYFWKLADGRSARWAVDRAVLLGDAAAGFLPTAGIGAGMAMESAGVLARRLLDTGRDGVAATLAAYERAQRPRVEAAQDNSRQLARLMFHRGRALAWLRDGLMRVVTLKAALGPIRRLLDRAPG